jgi:hypothetical protein
MLWPTCNGNAICWIVRFKMSNLHYNLWEANRLLEATINPQLDMIPLLDMDEFMTFCLAKIQTKSNMKLQ